MLLFLILNESVKCHELENYLQRGVFKLLFEKMGCREPIDDESPNESFFCSGV